MDIFEIKPNEREQTYRTMRDELSQEYSVHVGPTAQRNAEHQIAKQRAEGGHHGRAADSQERRVESDISSYEQRVHEKYLLAILTGRYDTGLWELAKQNVMWSNTFPERNAEIQKAAEIRLSEMN